MQFSDKLSYKILFIQSYGPKDINFASLTHLQEFSEKLNAAASFLTKTEPSPGHCPTGPGNNWAMIGRRLLCLVRRRLMGGARVSAAQENRTNQKGEALPLTGFELKMCCRSWKKHTSLAVDCI
jgi:hypothetical protein